MIKRSFLILGLITALGLCAPKPAQADPRTAAVIIGASLAAAALFEGGHYLYGKSKAFVKFCKEKPWWAAAGIGALAGTLILANDARKFCRIG